MLTTAELVGLVDDWNGIEGQTREDMSARADVLHRLINTRDDWVTAYNVARFTGYLGGLKSLHMFVRMVQSQAERNEADREEEKRAGK